MSTTMQTYLQAWYLQRRWKATVAQLDDQQDVQNDGATTADSWAKAQAARQTAISDGSNTGTLHDAQTAKSDS